MTQLRSILPRTDNNALHEGLASLQRRWQKYLSYDTEPTDADSLSTTLARLILLRLVLGSSILALVSWDLFANNSNTTSSSFLYLIIGGMFAVSAINAWALRFSRHLTYLSYGHLGTDFFLATLLIYATDSQSASFLLLLVIGEAAIVTGKRGALIVASLAGIVYATITSGVLSGPLGVPTPIKPKDVAVIYLSFLVVAVISTHIVARLRNLGTLAQNHAKDLDELFKRQQRLFDDLTQGIITLDMSSVITGVNLAARTILANSSLDPDLLIGKRLPSALRGLGVEHPDKALEYATTLSNPSDMTLLGKQDGQDIHLSFMVRPITDLEGTDSGRLFMFTDVSKVKDMEERLHLHERMAQLIADTDLQARPLHTGKNASTIIGESPIMKQISNLVDRIARSDASVLITGESGTGKELIAKEIHQRGPRANKPFIAVNCGAIPENLLESELFGHKKGAFTGAVTDNPGLFRQAQGGTLFLDEIGELPLHMQTKLLRVLQEKRVRPVGEVRDFVIEVRILAATNRDLKKEIAAGRFREDLFYRLNVVNILVPPLRERKEDIALLVRHFIGKYCNHDSPFPTISPEALHLLATYAFPGNIRELENIIERALVLGGHAILPNHLPDDVIQPYKREKAPELATSTPSDTQIIVLPVDLDKVLETLERKILVQALEKAGGTKKEAARLLGVNFRSLRYRLKKYNLADEQNSPNDDNS